MTFLDIAKILSFCLIYGYINRRFLSTYISVSTSKLFASITALKNIQGLFVFNFFYSTYPSCFQSARLSYSHPWSSLVTTSQGKEIFWLLGGLWPTQACQPRVTRLLRCNMIPNVRLFSEPISSMRLIRVYLECIR